MLQLIIAFLISIGFHIKPENTEAVQINTQEGANYGIVITDDVGTCTRMNLYYDEPSKTFKVQ